MSDITDTMLEDIAKGLGLSRAVFEERYDRFALQLNSPLFKKVAFDREQTEGPTADRDRRDFRAALITARDAGWVVRFVFENFTDLAQKMAADTGIKLQSLVNFNQPFADAKIVEAGTIAASRRCCQILIEEGSTQTPNGSGFLIGPHLVLTNHHVVAPLLTADGKVDPASKARLVCMFDHYASKTGAMFGPQSFRSSPAWLVASSPHREKTENAAELETLLDYAVIRLDGLPGYVRGWYDLAEIPVLPKVGAILEIWQFPAAQPMQISPGPRNDAPPGLGFEAADPQRPPRIFYTPNAKGGSSGSPVFDVSKRPVALHDAGFGDQHNGKPNRGIPLLRIREDCATLVSQAILEAPAKIGWHPDGTRPIIGRTRLHQAIDEAVRGRIRVIEVLTPPDPATRAPIPRVGRTFTHVMLEARLPPQDHHIAEFSAALIDPDPFVTAQRLVGLLAPNLVDTLPGASQETTLDADATGMLVDATATALLSVVPDKTLWVMIDNLDTHPIGTQWPSSAFLIALYRRAGAEARLRFVLVGLPRRLEGLSDMAGLGAEVLDGPPDDTALEDWLQANLSHGNWPRELAVQMTRLVRSVAASDPELDRICLTEATSRVLSKHARAAFGKGLP